MNITDIKTQNVKRILNCLRFCQGLTKKEISSITDLSFSTVSNICNELKDIHVLCNEKVEQSTIGRLPNRLSFQSIQYGSICLDIQMEGILGLAVLNFGNEVLFRSDYDISGFNTAPEIIRFAKQTFDSAKQDHPTFPSRIVGVGVSVSGSYDKDTGRLVNSAIPFLENTAIRGLVEQEFGRYCYVDNEANLCALSERCQNPDIRNLLYLHISQGLGAGIICEGNLLRGHHGYAAEISHIPLGNPSFQCPVCHSFGCAETTLCIKGITRTLLPGAEASPAPTGWEEITARVLAQPERFTASLSQIGEEIGTLLSVLLNLFDPEVVYMGGGIARLYQLIYPTVLSTIQNRCSFISQKGFQIRCDQDSSLTILQGLNQSIYEKWDGYHIPNTKD